VQRRRGLVHGYHRGVMASRDPEDGFRALAPEPFEEIDHPEERDAVWAGGRRTVVELVGPLR
jgi:hypothetical protein